jgi:hypothetical protein
MEPEPSFLEAFKDDPLYMLGAALLGLVALVGAGIAFLPKSPSARLSIAAVAMLLAFGALGVGALGTIHERNLTESAAETPGLTAADRERLTTYGNAEASYHLLAGAGSALPGGLLGLVALVLGLVRRPARAA